MSKTGKISFSIMILLIVVSVCAMSFFLRFRQRPSELSPVADSPAEGASASVPASMPSPSPQPVPSGSASIPSLHGPAASPSPEPDAPPEPMPLPPAHELTASLAVKLSDGTPAEILLDRSYTTKHVFKPDTSIEIAAPEDIYSLYLIWDLPPGEWALEGDGSQTCGKDGFIHEYIAISSPAQELSILLPPNGATLCSIFAFSEGSPPDWVQTWQPPWQEADLLALPTHADDEHLYFVGVLPYYAGELGYRVQVAYMTNHWNEPPRPHELLNGLWAVGIRNYPVISGFNDLYVNSFDQAEDLYGFDNFVNYQVELLRRFKPLVVVGHDLDGEYGNGAHMLNARALLTSVQNAADSSFHAASKEQYGVWDTPKLYLHLYPENAITMDWDVPLESFGGVTAFEMAVAGYDCHLSQHHWVFAVPQAGPTGHMFGLARSLVGPDIVGGDMFENISGRWHVTIHTAMSMRDDS